MKRPSSPEVYEQDAGASAQVNIQLDGAPPAVFTLHAQLKLERVRASAHERVKAGGAGLAVAGAHPSGCHWESLSCH